MSNWNNRLSTEEVEEDISYHPPTPQYWVPSPASLKGYSGVSIIHGLTHCETVLNSLSRDQVSRLLIYGVLSTSEMTARQQYTAVNGRCVRSWIKFTPEYPFNNHSHLSSPSKPHKGWLGQQPIHVLEDSVKTLPHIVHSFNSPPVS